MYEIYVVHKGGFTVKVEKTDDCDFGLELAKANAFLRLNVLIRVFKDGIFHTSYSVINGEVKELQDVTIPEEHW